MTITWEAAERRAEEFPGSWLDRLAWAVTLYATAAETDRQVPDVSLEELYYRLQQPRGREQAPVHQSAVAYYQPTVAWLHGQLVAMGHELLMPASGRLEYGFQPRLAMGDHPVDHAWLMLATVTEEGSVHDVSDGGTLTYTTCHRTSLLTQFCVRRTVWLDTQLVAQRGGWTRDTKVRVVGKPPGARDEQAVAVVLEPQWPWDHQRWTVLPGAPSSYIISYDSIPYLTSVHVDAEHLVAADAAHG